MTDKKVSFIFSQSKMKSKLKLRAITSLIEQYMLTENDFLTAMLAGLGIFWLLVFFGVLIR